MKQRVVVLFFFLMISAACGRASSPVTVTPAPLATSLPTIPQTLIPTFTPEPTEPRAAVATQKTSLFTFAKNPHALLIEADITGGFAPTPRQAHAPVYRLYADGFVVFAGERANPASGLDAMVKTGFLSDLQIQDLLNYLNQVDFFALNSYYQPKPTPTDLPTWRISVYLTKAKTVSVYAAGFPGTPPNFTEAFARITQTIPADSQPYLSTEGFLQSTSAGSLSDVGANVQVGEWSSVGVKLADAQDGVALTGNAYNAVLTLVGKQYPNALFREGDRVYRVRFAPTLPRAVHLTEWLGAIVDAPREFDGRAFDIVGYFRGANLLGEAQGSAPRSRSDWVVADASGAMWASGIAPAGLELNSARDLWNIVRLRAAVVYVRAGPSYLEARRVENLPMPIAPTATPLSINGADAAIAAVKARYPEVARINRAKAGIIGASTDITVIERSDGWDLVFWEGSGDCPAGCINHSYYYFSVKKTGAVQKMGEHSRIYNSAANSYDIAGATLWGVPN